jgi:pimeloyl-ACP methyl ester carboxylesterase
VDVDGQCGEAGEEVQEERELDSATYDARMVRSRRVGSLPVAVYDYGGEGPDVLLLHGGGRTYADWQTIGGLLAGDGFRAVAMDLRGHGDSGVAPWSWEAALSDVETVVEAVRLRHPVLIGHSLGGMVAALWTASRDDCPLAVNVDGHGNPVRAERLAGLSGQRAAAAVASFRAQLHPFADGYVGATGRPVSGEIIPAHSRRPARSAAICGIAAAVAGMSCIKMIMPSPR